MITRVDLAQLTPGTHLNVTLCGKEIVIFRPESGGSLGVLDAACPHLGAHIGAAGRVVGDCMECPFHAWRFNAKGEVVWTPSMETMGDRLPPKSGNVRSYPVVERNGLVLVWMSSLQHRPQILARLEPLLPADLNTANYCGEFLPPVSHLPSCVSDDGRTHSSASAACTPDTAICAAVGEVAMHRAPRSTAAASSTASSTPPPPPTPAPAARVSGIDSMDLDEPTRLQLAAESLAAARANARGTVWEGFAFPPLWEVPVVAPGVESGEWVWHGYTEHVVGAHAQELPENGADVAHLDVLHRPFILDLLMSLLEHEWHASWEGKPPMRGQLLAHAVPAKSVSPLLGGGSAARDAAARSESKDESGDAAKDDAAKDTEGVDAASIPLVSHAFNAGSFVPTYPSGKPGVPVVGPHNSRIVIDEHMRARGLGFRVPGGSMHVEIVQAGPATVFLQMHTPFGPVLVIETVMVVEPLKQVVRHCVFAPPHIPRLVAKFVLGAVAAQYERDLEIWCNKQYRPRPVLTRADPNITVFRRWYSQFYSPGCVSFKEAWIEQTSQGLDW